MKKRILTIFALFLIGVLVVRENGFNFLQANEAYAIGDLNVSWESDPMFNESNIAPGFTTTKTVGVQNAGATPRAVAIKGIKTTDTGNMDSAMNVEIKEGASVLYSDTLENFFDDSSSPFGVFLSNLNDGNSTDYDIKITFNQSAGNEFQNQSIVFDLQIGITIELPQACQSINFPNNAIVGTSGNDKIKGTGQNDLIVTYEGDDKITGGGGNDCIITMSGKDTVDGGTGNDVIDLGTEDDKSTASSGSDIVIGGEGKDDIDSGSDNDFVYGGLGNDKLEGGSGNDQVFGEANDDKLSGGSGTDILIGGLDLDNAKGGSGTDTCDSEVENTCEL